MTKEYVTHEELKELLIDLDEKFYRRMTDLDERFNNRFERMDNTINQIGKNVSRAISDNFQFLVKEQERMRKESDERIMKFEKEQTERLLKVLNKYEIKTESHEKFLRKLYQNLKDYLKGE